MSSRDPKNEPTPVQSLRKVARALGITIGKVRSAERRALDALYDKLRGVKQELKK